MRKSIFFLLALFSFSFETFAQVNISSGNWENAPPQKIDSEYVRNFGFKHDKGFYLAIGMGPQWNASLNNPQASAFRFGGKVSMGFVPFENFALHLDAWGNFLEEATLVAVGPGITYFFASDFALGASFGVGRVFSVGQQAVDFRETVLAFELNASKYWWTSENTSFGISLVSGMHGLTLSSGNISTAGLHVGLRGEFLFN